MLILPTLPSWQAMLSAEQQNARGYESDVRYYWTTLIFSQVTDPVPSLQYHCEEKPDRKDSAWPTNSSGQSLHSSWQLRIPRKLARSLVPLSAGNRDIVRDRRPNFLIFALRSQPLWKGGPVHPSIKLMCVILHVVLSRSQSHNCLSHTCAF